MTTTSRRIDLSREEGRRMFALFVPFLVLLVTIDLLFMALNAASIIVINGVYDIFYMGAEANLPTWWSSAKLLLAGLCFLAVAFRTCRSGATAFWMALLGLAFVAMSADEVSSMHEWVGSRLDGASRDATAFHHTGLWFVVVGVPFIVVMVIVLRKLWAALDAVPCTPRRLVLGLALLLCGALMIEALGNFTFPPEGMEGNAFARSLYLYSVVMEEGIEMIGSSVLLWGSFVFVMHHPSMPGLAKLARPEAKT
jgi:hypothetical protein